MCELTKKCRSCKEERDFSFFRFRSRNLDGCVSICNICRPVKIGVYKITSPSGRIYIGESEDVYERWKLYKRLSCKNQIRLYNSFLEYGVEKHNFEIIEECAFDALLCRERHWQDHYDVLNQEKGMNCKLSMCGDKKQKRSRESIEKTNQGNRGKKLSPEHIQILKTASLGNKYNLGRVHTPEHIEKVRQARLGRKMTPEQREVNRQSKLGVKHTEERKANQKKASLERYKDPEIAEMYRRANSKIFLNIENGIFYYGYREAGESIGVKETTLRYRMDSNTIYTPFIIV